MPLPHEPIGGQTALEIAAIQARNSLIPKNLYNGVASANEYSATHTRALADQTTPHYGKGTGNFLDIYNYAAGADWDVFGNQAEQYEIGWETYANNSKKHSSKNGKLKVKKIATQQLIASL